MLVRSSLDKLFFRCSWYVCAVEEAALRARKEVLMRSCVKTLDASAAASWARSVDTGDLIRRLGGN